MMPHLQQGAKVIGKKALQTGVNMPKMFLTEVTLKRQSASAQNKPSVYLHRIHCKDNQELAKRL